MNKRRQKHRIYTFVIGKNVINAVIITLLTLAFGVGLAYIPKYNSGEVYVNFLKLCVSNSLHGSNKTKTVVSLPSIGADTLMKTASPIFAESEKAVPVFNSRGDEKVEAAANETEANAEEQITKQPTSQTAEKNYYSDNLKISNATSYKINATELVQKAGTYNGTGDVPKVLIMHTHGCETYSNDDGIGIGDVGSYRSTNLQNNVTRLGELLCDKLKAKGISAIHDKTLCDYPAYNSAYKKALGLIDWYKNKYPSIEFVFDIHRDAIAQTDGTPVKLTSQVGGEKCAQIMIVCGTDQLGLSHPYWKDNLIFALKIQDTMERKYPGLMRPLNLREERFNMHQTKGSLIFEIGTHANTMNETMLSINYLAEGLGQILSGSN